MATPILSLCGWGSTWGFLDNSPVKCTGPFSSKTPPKTMMLPLPCFTFGMVFFTLKASLFHLHTDYWTVCPNSSIFVSSDPWTLFQRLVITCNLQSANCLEYELLGSGDVRLLAMDALVPDASNNFISYFLLSWVSAEDLRPKCVPAWEFICVSFLNIAVFVSSQGFYACIQLFAQMLVVLSFVWKIAHKKEPNRLKTQIGYLDKHTGKQNER